MSEPEKITCHNCLHGGICPYLVDINEVLSKITELSVPDRKVFQCIAEICRHYSYKEKIK